MTVKKSPTPKGRTKSEMFRQLAEATNLSRKQISAVFDGLAKIIKDDLGKKGPGVCTIPGLLKLKVVHKPARPAGERMDPFTKQMKMFKAKPAYNVVRARPLKSLKDMVK